MGFNAGNLIKIINDKNINKFDLAKSNKVVTNELKNNLTDTYNLVENLTIEQSIKYILWNGLLNQYGIHGIYKNQSRGFGKKGNKKYYNDKHFSRGKVLSIDFGTSNMGKEFSYTHSGIVIADYTGIVVVVPITSQKEYGLSKLPDDIKSVTIPLLKKQYPDIEEDSYILINQIKAVSKNRITKEITSLSKTEIMKQIEEMLFKTQTPYIRKINKDKADKLENRINELENRVRELEKALDKIE